MPWPLVRIISGGQTGADQAGIAAALRLGYETGGMMPKDFRTERGLEPSLAAYGLVESASRAYTPRTWWNIMHSDGTVIFTNHGDTLLSEMLYLDGGSLYTAQLCDGNHKPYLVNPDAHYLRGWIMDCHIQTLNIAGNRESKSPGIHDRVIAFLVEALRKP